MLQDYNNIFSAECQQLKALTDRKKTHSNINDTISRGIEISKRLQENQKINFLNCGSIIGINDNGEIKAANFCKNKLCPVCAFRKSLKSFTDNMKIFNFIVDNFEKQFIFLTLTIVNKKKLSEGLTEINNGFKRFSNNRRFKKISKGYIRQLEITYNEKEKTWHPHLHLIICVNKSYFKSADYTKQSEWADMWRESVRDYKIQAVDVRKFNFSAEDRDFKPIFEISKYLAKVLELTSIKDKNEAINKIAELLDETYHMRQGTRSGLFRETAKMFGIKDDEDEDLKEEVSEDLHTLVWKGDHYEEIKR